MALMRYWPLFPFKSGCRHSCTGRTWLKVLGVILVLLLLVGIVIAIWAGRRYRQVMDLGKTAQVQYGQVAKEFPFTAPPSGSSQTARLEAMLRVRERAYKAIDPQMTDFIRQAMGSSNIDQLTSLAPRALSMAPALEQIMQAHLTALRGEHMSPAEYQWLLGLAVREALRRHDPAQQAFQAEQSSAGGKAADGYRQLLSQFQAMTVANNKPQDDFGAEAWIKDLHQSYRDQTLDRPDVLAQLDAGPPSFWLLDLLTASSDEFVDLNQIKQPASH